MRGPPFPDPLHHHVSMRLRRVPQWSGLGGLVLLVIGTVLVLTGQRDATWFAYASPAQPISARNTGLLMLGQQQVLGLVLLGLGLLALATAVGVMIGRRSGPDPVRSPVR